MLVSGRSGSGKTTLLNAFLDGLSSAGEAVVLSGRCYERESVPYKALDSVVDALSRYLMTLPGPEVAALLPRDVALLARMFPVLRRVEAIAACKSDEAAMPDDQELRRRATAALRELLAAIGREMPLVVAIDDLHWGDDENALLLGELTRPPDAPVMLLLGSFRTDEGALCPLIQSLRGPASTGDGQIGLERVELAVGELTQAESRELALSLLGADDAVARVEAHGVARESRGNPFFIDELVKHILSGEGLASRQSPTQRLTLEEVLWSRVARLPDDARRLLEVIAVSGRPVGLAEACQAADLDPGSAGRAAAAVLRGGRLIRGAGRRQRDEVETYHDWVRETVVAHLPPETSAGYHLRLALVLEASGRAKPEALAVHYQGGGRPEWAALHYVRAADAAAELFDFLHAASLYRLALQLGAEAAAASGTSSPPSAADTARVRARLGDALANAGHGRDAAAEYLAAAKMAEPAEAIELERRAATQYLIGGQVDLGFALMRTLSQARGIPVPAGPTGAMAALVARRALLWARGLSFVPREAGQIPADELSLIDLCWSAGASLSTIDPIRGADFQTRGLLHALRAGEPYRVARALTLEAASLSMAGTRATRRVEGIFARAEEIAQSLKNPHLQGLLALTRGVAALMVGSWRAALDWFTCAEPILRERCTGVTWELNTLHNVSLWALTHLGDLDELRRRWALLVHEAHSRGDLYAVATLNTYYMAFLRLAANEPDRALAELDQGMEGWSAHGYHIQHSAALRAVTTIALYQGDAHRAWTRVREEWPRFERSLLPRMQLLRIQLNELRGRCALAAAGQTDAMEPLLREARRAAIKLEREGAAWALAHATMLRAGLAARADDRDTAIRLLREAAARYDAVDMSLNAVIARRCAGELLAGDDRECLVAQSDAALASRGVLDPIAFSAIFAPWTSHLPEPSTLSNERQRKAETEDWRVFDSP
jgi:hypothetical protein